jgi:hypothetical protein
VRRLKEKKINNNMKKNKNTKKYDMTEDIFFNDVDIKNNNIVCLKSIMKELEDKIDKLGLPVSFIKKN